MVDIRESNCGNCHWYDGECCTFQISNNTREPVVGPIEQHTEEGIAQDIWTEEVTMGEEIGAFGVLLVHWLRENSRVGREKLDLFEKYFHSEFDLLSEEVCNKYLDRLISIERQFFREGCFGQHIDNPEDCVCCHWC